MADSVLLLGAAVVRTACKFWLRDQPWAADAAGSVLDVLQSRATDTRERRRVQRLFEDMEERVHDNVLQNMDIEFRCSGTNTRPNHSLSASSTALHLLETSSVLVSWCLRMSTSPVMARLIGRAG